MDAPETTPSTTAAPPVPLHERETWLFDLDNTMYPASINLFDEIDRRMCEFIADFLRLDHQAAYKIQKQYFREHGTSLKGLMNEHDMDPAPYLDYVHEVDMSRVPRNDRMNEALSALPGRKIVFTNASKPYAERVLDRLGVSHHIEAVFDIVDANYVPKPERAPYEQLIAQHAVDPAGTVMVEDVARNLIPAAEMGMTTVWVQTDRPWATVEGSSVTPDYQITDLGDWLHGIVS